MRVTNGYMANNLMRNLNSNRERLDLYNEQLSTGKKFTLPFQDPAGVVKSMRLKSTVSNNEQYISNIEDGISWLQANDSALNNANEIMQRARELSVRGATGSLSKTARLSVADEIKQLRESLTEVANTTHKGKYIFSGHKTLTKPYEEVDGEYQGDSSSINKEVSEGTDLKINQTGEFFKDMLDELGEIVEDLEQGNLDDVSNNLGELDKQLEDLLKTRSEVGAKQNRLELTKNRLNDNQIQFKKLLSENEDVDIAETIMNLKMSENVYRASLSSGARIIQPTLVDFIK